MNVIWDLELDLALSQTQHFNIVQKKNMLHVSVYQDHIQAPSFYRSLKNKYIFNTQFFR